MDFPHKFVRFADEDRAGTITNCGKIGSYLAISLRFNSSSGVAEDFDRLVQLLDLERLFQNGNWTDL